MQQFNSAGRQAISDLSQRYQLSTEAVEHMLIAVNNGSGTMAQFNCPELGGGGQWMRGGMTMVGDIFNTGLQSRVDQLCNELSQLLANTQVFEQSAQGGQSGQWWPAELGAPFSSGAQNNTRYAVFNGRLAVDVQGTIMVYNTLDHQISGVSQQQGGDSSLTFSSQYGTLSVNSLPLISSTASGNNTHAEPAPNHNFAAPAPASAPNAAPLPANDVQAPYVDAAPAPTTQSPASDEILALIEKLAQLHQSGVLNDDEFNAKKQELLSRL